jgi:ATP-binding cassette subfamily B protein
MRDAEAAGARRAHGLPSTPRPRSRCSSASKLLAKNRTAIIISHRFSTVRMADRIAVLEGGRVTELGTHEALVAKGGRYAKLFALQAQGYR